jgi:DNA repair protein RecO (recombination protein O)
MSDRSRELNTRGIVLRKIPFKETSYIVDVLSKDFGHISLMAKGARSAKSKYVGQLELLNELDLTLYHNPSSEWHIYKSSSLIKAHLFETTFRVGIVMQAAVEILRQILVTNYDACEMYELFHKYLEYIETVKNNEIAIFWRFLLSLFKNIGIEFNLESCIMCSRKDNFVGYFPQKHGFVCKECYRPIHESYILSFNAEIRDLFQNLPQIGNYLEDLKLSKNNIKRINQILLLHLTEHLHKTFYLKSLELY